jgi:hypothetical protein
MATWDVLDDQIVVSLSEEEEKDTSRVVELAESLIDSPKFDHVKWITLLWRSGKEKKIRRIRLVRD